MASTYAPQRGRVIPHRAILTTACAAALLLAACGGDEPPAESVHVQAAHLACGLDGDLLVTTVRIFIDDDGPELALMRDGCPAKLRGALEELGRADLAD